MNWWLAAARILITHEPNMPYFSFDHKQSSTKWSVLIMYRFITSNSFNLRFMKLLVPCLPKNIYKDTLTTLVLQYTGFAFVTTPVNELSQTNIVFHMKQQGYFWQDLESLSHQWICALYFSYSCYFSRDTYST